MPNPLDPNDPTNPASPFAPAQPAAGVVADDVPDEQNPAGGPKASEVSTDHPAVKPVLDKLAGKQADVEAQTGNAAAQQPSEVESKAPAKSSKE